MLLKSHYIKSNADNGKLANMAGKNALMAGRQM